MLLVVVVLVVIPQQQRQPTQAGRVWRLLCHRHAEVLLGQIELSQALVDRAQVEVGVVIVGPIGVSKWRSFPPVGAEGGGVGCSCFSQPACSLQALRV